jgi:diacylglycerol kinase (ATP)
VPARNSTVSLIANPAAGRAGAVGQAETLARALAHRGWTADLRYTEHPGHAIRLARQAALTHDTLVAIGGDGTASEVATGLLLAQRPDVRLGLLPCGTGNDVAQQLRLRSGRETLDAVVADRWRLMDAIEVQGLAQTDSTPHFALSFVAAGFAAELVRRTTPVVKRWGGRRLAYTIGFLHALLHYRAPLVRVCLDGREYLDRFLHICAGNVEYAGGGIMRISPGARMDDGRLNLCLIRAKGWREILRNFPRLLRGTFPGRPGVTYTEGTTLEVLGNVPLPLQVDGSMLGVTPVRCQIRPGALRVAAPAPADG